MRPEAVSNSDVVDKMGGMPALSEVASAQAKAFFNKPLLPAFSLAFAIAISTLSVPSFRQRVYSGDSVENIKKSFLYTGILYIFFSFSRPLSVWLLIKLILVWPTQNMLLLT